MCVLGFDRSALIHTSFNISQVLLSEAYLNTFVISPSPIKPSLLITSSKSPPSSSLSFNTSSKSLNRPSLLFPDTLNELAILFDIAFMFNHSVGSWNKNFS